MSKWNDKMKKEFPKEINIYSDMLNEAVYDKRKEKYALSILAVLETFVGCSYEEWVPEKVEEKVNDILFLVDNLVKAQLHYPNVKK